MAHDIFLGRTPRDWSCGRAAPTDPPPEPAWERLPPAPALAEATPRRANYLQNHLWVDACGMATAALAIWDEVPATRGWIALTLDKWRRTHEALGDDGASHEGVPYWSYGVEYLLKFMSLAREQLGVNFYDHDWWRKTADYRLYLGLPRHAWTPQNTVVDIADAPRADFSYGPDYLLRALAHEYRHGHGAGAEEDQDVRADSLGRHFREELASHRLPPARDRATRVVHWRRDRSPRRLP